MSKEQKRQELEHIMQYPESNSGTVELMLLIYHNVARYAQEVIDNPDAKEHVRQLCSVDRQKYQEWIEVLEEYALKSAWTELQSVSSYVERFKVERERRVRPLQTWKALHWMVRHYKLKFC